MPGIDVDATPGLVPDRRWRNGVTAFEQRCRVRRWIAKDADTQTAGRGGCGIYGTRPWSLGDGVNLAIGQGDLQSNPLQTAVAYAALVNGGTVVRPHLANAAISTDGATRQRFLAPPARRLKIAKANRAAIMSGLQRAVRAPGGTSTQVFAGTSPPWDHDRFPVFGKTGTVENLAQKTDQSWYAAYAYDRSPKRKPIIIVATVERGGFGADTAAPIVRLMLSQWFGVKPAPTPAPARVSGGGR